ncbi:MAG: hypothetical protein A3F10_04555 [Coxiella sp. RIFCSPHIGHO2_12_FULL_42_15]|nr:MAG: hypothetical protein A3F10_04555 [Coxiella sp. RIFCSPHIGHO2_12_FULL_42_15]
MSYRFQFFVLCVLSFLLLGCDRYSTPVAPIIEQSRSDNPHPDLYRVGDSDTLYSIAWAYQRDYRELALLNHLSPPYALRVGQWLRIKPAGHYHAGSTTTSPSVPLFESPRASRRWQWPTQGRVVARFSNKPFAEKGISLTGRLGQPVVAALPGMVVYSGAGVRGYGNLIIIKHNQNYLSAYAFNQRNWVKDDDNVAAGQEIAEMGRDNMGRVRLYFEIRYNGRPVNPLPYLR